jgi:16S rRNA (cytosine967-C5)-methyltransferase
LSVAQAPVARRDGLAARRLAHLVIEDVLRRRRPLDERLDRLQEDTDYIALSPGDRGLTRAIALSALRGLGIVRKSLSARLQQGMPAASGRLEPILIAATAQLLFLGVADHAAVDTAVELAREDRHARHFAGLANATLRGIGRDKATILAGIDPLADNTPAWLATGWREAYGEATAAAIAAAHLHEPPPDHKRAAIEAAIARARARNTA